MNPDPMAVTADDLILTHDGDGCVRIWNAKTLRYLKRHPAIESGPPLGERAVTLPWSGPHRGPFETYPEGVPSGGKAVARRGGWHHDTLAGTSLGGYVMLIWDVIRGRA